MIVDLTYPDGHWEEWTGLFPGFLTAVAQGARPTRHVDGSYYDVSFSPQGELTLDGCPISRVFAETCGTVSTVIDDRRVQLFNPDGTLAADIPAADAFVYATTSTWELWDAYYRAAGFTTSRTGNWNEVIIEDPITGEPLPTWEPPLQQAGFTGYLPYIVGGLVLYALFRR